MPFPTTPEPASPADPPLFDLPSGARVPRRRVVLVTGPSGSGKTSLARRLGLPVVNLDDFYRDADHPGLPRRHGIVDWDSPATWDVEAAHAALLDACRSDRVDVPVYDIPTSQRTGTQTVDLDAAPLVLAEGIFAAELVDPLSRDGVLADAVHLTQGRLVTFWRRLARDVGESRKPIAALLRRGTHLLLAEPRMVRRWESQGTRPLAVEAAEHELRALAAHERTRHERHPT
ncbi:uridine kinase family protein [Beutenbergia cavernae]|uniref:uridine kinase family protein n=1 Tax=Beutenbergia cavernae TaxID=84757 RepID=UPI00117D1D77|nr:ATP-binding protein [Beutenbergia cavernae]